MKIPACWRNQVALPLIAVLCGGFWVADANAHARWQLNGSTPPRTADDNNKAGPCKQARTATPVVFEAGKTVTLQWEATIYHKGYFRLAFSPADDAGFDQNVLKDNIREVQGKRFYSAEVTLPATPCTECTLQLIQVMEDRTPPTNYYSCADIQLKAPSIPIDSTPPAAVKNVNLVGSEPSVTLNWANPSTDFAGVVIVRSDAAAIAPTAGMAYQIGDATANGRVVYVGMAQTFTLSDAKQGETLTIFSVDASFNYGAGKSHIVPVASNQVPQVSLHVEQLGFGDNQIYAADGPVHVQAWVSDANTGDAHTLQWSIPSDVASEVGDARVTLNPATALLNTPVTLSVTATDSGEPPLSATASTIFSVLPQSRYQPVIAVYQGGKKVTKVDANNGAAEVRVEFASNAPDNLADWQWDWQHNLPSATQVAPTVVRFSPVGTATYSIALTPTTPAGVALAPQMQTLNVTKPIALGVLNLWCLVLLAGLRLLVASPNLKR